MMPTKLSDFDAAFIDAELPPLDTAPRTVYERRTWPEYLKNRKSDAAKRKAARTFSEVGIGEIEPKKLLVSILAGPTIPIRHVDVSLDVYEELRIIARSSKCSVHTVVRDFIVRGLALYRANPELVRPQLRARKTPNTTPVIKHDPIEVLPLSKRPTLGDE